MPHPSFTQRPNLPFPAPPGSRRPRLLLIDGGSHTHEVIGPQFADVLDGLIPGVEFLPVELPSLAAGNARDPAVAAMARKPLDYWDGVLWAGAPRSVRLCQQPEGLITAGKAIMEAFFKAAVPQFASGWGLHLATVLTGGEVIAHPSGGVFPFAHSIALTQCGVTHPMMAQRPMAYSAPSLHPEIIESLTGDAQVLAISSDGVIQACEIPWLGGRLWGVQTLPECDLRDIAILCKTHGDALIQDGWFADQGQLNAYYRRALECQMTPRRDLMLALGVPEDITRDALRQAELRAWLVAQVFPRIPA